MLSLVAPTGAALQIPLYANTMTIKALQFQDPIPTGWLFYEKSFELHYTPVSFI